jgi:hypothetical protein
MASEDFPGQEKEVAPPVPEPVDLRLAAQQDAAQSQAQAALEMTFGVR